MLHSTGRVPKDGGVSMRVADHARQLRKARVCWKARLLVEGQQSEGLLEGSAAAYHPEQRTEEREGLRGRLSVRHQELQHAVAVKVADGGAGAVCRGGGHEARVGAHA